VEKSIIKDVCIAIIARHTRLDKLNKTTTKRLLVSVKYRIHTYRVIHTANMVSGLLLYKNFVRISQLFFSY